MKKTILNIFYNAIYQIFLVLVPLITVPYLSRTLGPSAYGVYSSVNSTTAFLMVFCSFSVAYVGMRTISRVRSTGTQEELTSAFWGLWYIQAIASIVMIIGTVTVVTIFKLKYWNYFLLMIPFLISAQLDISWFFQGLEQFGKVVLRNTIVKLMSVVLIFAFVKSRADLGKYMLIMSITTLLGSMIFWLGIREHVGKPTWKFYKLRQSMNAVTALLISTIATQIYTLLDKPMLGLFRDSTQVSFYDNSQRISNMILGVITSITIVMMPKMAAETKETQKIILKKSLEVTTLLGLIFAVIVMINTKQFVPFFFGKKYIPMTNLMFWFTLTIVIIPIGEVFANQFALANRRDREFEIPVIIGAILQIILACILNKPFGAMGALIAILVVQFTVTILRVWIVRDDYEFKYVFHDIPKYFLIAIIAFIVGMLLPNLITSVFFNMVIKSIIVIALYICLMYLFKFDLNKDIVYLVKKFLKKA